MKNRLKVKVCGLKYTSNRQAIEKLPVDMLGFIFYPESKRFVGKITEPCLFDTHRVKVAVFVDEDVKKILNLVKHFNIEYVQLHGKENPETCMIIKKQGVKIIKAFNVDEEFDFSQLNRFDTSVNYFLFDTKTKLPGGSGIKFNWDLLSHYTGKIPFFLSGGIKPEDAEQIYHLDHPRLLGIDLNSGFENSPGDKDYESIKIFIEKLNADYQV